MPIFQKIRTRKCPEKTSKISFLNCRIFLRIIYHLLAEQLEQGKLPVRQKIGARETRQCPSSPKISNAHKLESPYAIVVRNADQTSTSPCEVSTQRWLATANGALPVWFVPLAKDLPKPVIHESEAPAAEEHIPIRITAY